MNLEFFVRDKRLTRKGREPLVGDTAGHYTFTIDFDEEWDGLAVLVVFRNGSRSVQMLYRGQMNLPAAVSGRGDLYVACHGYRKLGDSVAVLRTIRMSHPVRLLGSEPMAGGDPEEYTPTVFEQVMAAAAKAETAASNLLDLRDSGALTGPPGPQGLPGPRGPDGADGRNGVGISMVTFRERTEAGNVYTVWLTDGSGYDITAPVGPQGPEGTAGGTGDGIPGEDGGYYTPAVTQVDTDTMRVSYAASKTGMPGVAAVDVTLPSGKDGYTPVKGKDYVDGIDGEDGVGIRNIVFRESNNTGYVYTVNLTDNTSYEITAPRGPQGTGGGGGSGGAGTDGVGIQSIQLKKEDAAGNTYTILLTDGSSYDFTAPAGPAGKDGTNGSDGKNGTSVTVSSVNESTADGGTNIVTFSDGKKLNVRNGSKGNDGSPGADGKDGVSPTITVSAITGGHRLTVHDAGGQKTVDILDGEDGSPGADGKTPVKGTDYFTEADKQELVTAVLNALPAAEEATF